MRGFLLIYYAVCYSVGGASVIVSLIAARSRSSPPDARFAAFLLSLALILVPFSVWSYTGATADLRVLFLVLWLVIAIGEALMIASLPRFIHSLLPVPGQKAVEAIWTVAAVIAFGCQPVIAILRTATFLLFVPMALMPAAIAYVGTVFVARGLGDQGWKPGIGEAEIARWKSTLKAITLISTVSLPFLLAVDFFPEILIALGIKLPLFFKVFPLVYAALSLVYLGHTLPLFLSVSSLAAPVVAEALDESSLSAREMEVARLLIAGLRYRDIGESLFISLSTVKTHVERIYRKTGARNKLDLLRRLRSG